MGFRQNSSEISVKFKQTSGKLQETSSKLYIYTHFIKLTTDCTLQEDFEKTPSNYQADFSTSFYFE